MGLSWVAEPGWFTLGPLVSALPYLHAPVGGEPVVEPDAGVVEQVIWGAGRVRTTPLEALLGTGQVAA
jgi:hypothetical protein